MRISSTLCTCTHLLSVTVITYANTTATNTHNMNSVEMQLGNLPLDATKADVEELCSYFGRLRRVTVPSDRYNPSQNRGIAYVTFVRTQKPFSG